MNSNHLKVMASVVCSWVMISFSVLISQDMGGPGAPLVVMLCVALQGAMVIK